MIQWILAHIPVILGVLLAVSEALALVFPPSSGFGGFIQGLVKFLQSIGAKDPNQPSK